MFTLLSDPTGLRSARRFQRFALVIVGFVVVATATSHAQAIAVTPFSIEFNTIPAPGMSGAMPITVSNAGADPITLTDATLSGDIVFAVGSAAGALQPGATRKVDVTFVPVAAGDASALITFAATDNTIAPRSVAVHGTAVPAKLQATPSTLDFGVVTIGANEPRTTTLMNISPDVVQLQSVSSNSTDFVATGVDTTGPIAPNATTTFGVTFAPTKEGAATGSLAVTLVGGNAPEVTLVAVGNGSVVPGSDGTQAAPGGCCNVDGSHRGDGVWMIVGLVFVLGRRRRRVSSSGTSRAVSG